MFFFFYKQNLVSLDFKIMTFRKSQLKVIKATIHVS